jgi:hypothetical protein
MRSNVSRYVRQTIDLQWSSLPQHFRLERPLKSYDRDPVELDLLLGVKLNHLHVVFLLHLALLRNMTEPNAAIISVSAEMLGLVVEAFVLKDRLIDSSTSLLSKVGFTYRFQNISHGTYMKNRLFGLSAAGIICLTLLQPSFFVWRRTNSSRRVSSRLGYFGGRGRKGKSSSCGGRKLCTSDWCYRSCKGLARPATPGQN